MKGLKIKEGVVGSDGSSDISSVVGSVVSGGSSIIK